MAEKAKILFIGDIIGKPGRGAVRELLPALIESYSPDVIIANGENTAGGFGITPEVADTIFSFGIDCITSGNHIWDKKEIMGYIDDTPALLRPLNYPEDSPGKGVYTYKTRAGFSVAVINICGTVFMEELASPFHTADKALSKLGGEPLIKFVDLHCEATSEKVAMGWYLDGRVTALVGTHTHIQTSDERILPEGTAYITDAGMTGPTDSVIGVKKELVLERFLTKMPVRFDVAKDGVELQGVFIEADPVSGKALSIERIKLPLDN